jgi:hypothetical protein
MACRSSVTGIYAFGDLTYGRGCMLELAFPGELHSERGGPEVEQGQPTSLVASAMASTLA